MEEREGKGKKGWGREGKEEKRNSQPQGPKGPWSSSEYSGKLPSPPPAPLNKIVKIGVGPMD